MSEFNEYFTANTLSTVTNVIGESQRHHASDTFTVNTNIRKRGTKIIRNSDFIKNVAISHEGTGIMLYEHKYKWEENISNTIFVGNLVTSFYKLARQIDDGAVTSINFESRCSLDKSATPPPEPHQELDNNENFNSPEEIEAQYESMKMVTARVDEDIILTVFYDLQGMQDLTCQYSLDTVSIYMDALKANFMELCSDFVQDIRPLLSSLAASDSKIDENDLKIIKSKVFLLFSEVECGLHEQYFPKECEDSRDSF